MQNGFGGYSYHEGAINKSYNSKTRNGSNNPKLDRDASSNSRQRHVKFEMDEGGVLSDSKEAGHRRGKLKLDQELLDKNSMIRKSLQSDSYYRRHR